MSTPNVAIAADICALTDQLRGSFEYGRTFGRRSLHLDDRTIFRAYSQSSIN
jgi:hypothetical protein